MGSLRNACLLQPFPDLHWSQIAYCCAYYLMAAYLTVTGRKSLENGIKYEAIFNQLLCTWVPVQLNIRATLFAIIYQRYKQLHTVK